MCFWVHTYHFITASITPTLRHVKREHDLYQNINHHSLYVNKFRISPFTMRTSMRAGNATFPELINHTQWVIWQSTPNTGWGAAIPRAQTRHLMWRIPSGDHSFLTSLADIPLPTSTNKKCLPQSKKNNRIRGDCGMSVTSSVVV